MAHIFISYSKKDIIFANRLHKLLEDESFAVWMDEAELDPSDQWWPTIERNIETCAAFIVIMSPNARTSRWVEREILYAEKLNKPIYPVLYRGQGWPRLADIQYTDMRTMRRPRLPAKLRDELREDVPTSDPRDVPPQLGDNQRTQETRTHLTRSRRRWMLALAGLAALAVVIVIALLLLNGGEDETATGLIAFSSNRDGYYELYVMDADGENLRQLTDNNALDYNPAWSPDGSQIAFQSDRDGNWELYVMDADGSNAHRLTTNSTNDYDPAWSPDGSRIAFVSDRSGNLEVYVMDADGENASQLTDNGAENYIPAWSPDGSQIAFESRRDGNGDIYVIDADGSNPRNLTTGSGGGYTPAWSPDGDQIAFASRRDGNYEIYVMDADGSNPQRVAENNEADDYYPTWASDGSTIAFQSFRNNNWKIYVMDADGGNPRSLTNHDASDSSPAWQPVRD